MSDPLNDRIVDVESAVAALRSEYDKQHPPQPSNIIRVTAGSRLQTVIDSAPVNSILQLEDGTYEGAIKVPKALSFKTLNPPPPGRATGKTPVVLTCNDVDTVTITNTSDVVNFTGIGITNRNLQGGCVSHVGAHAVFDRCTGFGDPLMGLRRGYILNGADVQILGCYFDDIILSGKETVVIGGADGTRDIVIDDCFVRGGAESIMWGGADSKSIDRIPTRIKITRCHLTKKLEWYTAGRQIKNAFEVKCGIDITMTDCLLEYAGLAEGQGAYLMLFTVRNQDGTAPWSCIKNVVVERCNGRYCGGGINFLGQDYNHTSDILDGVTVRNCNFSDITRDGPWTYTDTAGQIHTGAGRIVVFDKAPRNVKLDALNFLAGANAKLGALGYFPDPVPQPSSVPVGLTLSNWKYPMTQYGWKIDNGSQDIPPAAKNLKLYMPDMTYAITANDAGAVGYPAFPA